MRGQGLVVAAVAAAAIPAARSAKAFAQCAASNRPTAQVSRRSTVARAPLFGIHQHPSLTPPDTTHVEVLTSSMETPSSSSVTDEHDNEVGRYLSIRGGHNDNIAESAESAEGDSCTTYSTVGIINLRPPDDQEDVGTRLARHLEEELLPSSSHADDGVGPKILGLPNVGETSALVGNFVGNSDESTSDAPYETIGILSDTVFVLMREDDEEDNEASILVDGIASVLKGLTRRVGGDGSKPRLVIYIQSHADHQGYVRCLLRSALANLQEDKSESKWDSISALQSDVDIVALPYNAQNVAQMAATGKIFASQSQSDAPKAVPLSSFEALATQVYRALSRSPAAGVEFHAVSAVSESDEVSFSETIAESVGVGDTDDIYNYDASPDVESEGPAECDDIGVETELLHDAEPAPLDTSKETASYRLFDSAMLLSELTGGSRRILLECERKMGDLEAKQDDFLLNSDQGMPILEFGGDAEAIIADAAASFDEIAEDATGAAEIDESIQAQIEEIKTDLLMDVAGDSGVRHLFEFQLQSLREYYGRRYEAVLDEILDGTSEGGESRSKEKQEAILTAAAQRAAEGFRTAAGNAMPSSCRDGGRLESLDFSIIITRDLNGLMQDMIEATKSRQELEEDWDNAATGEVEAEKYEKEGSDDNDGGKQTRRQRKGPAKWYEKIAARALVLGVNYLQGWLALQQLRKAAADRDKAMPKFPLF